MSAKVNCVCPEKATNLGYGDCPPNLGFPKGFAEQDIKNSLGMNNFIDCSKPFDQACLDTLIKNSDSTQQIRFYPNGDIEDIEKTQGENLYQDLQSGKRCFLGKGTTSVQFKIYAPAYTQIAEKINNKKCKNLGFYDVFSCGTLRGIKGENGQVLPYPIENLTATPIDGVNKTSCGYVQVEFDIVNTKDDLEFAYVYAVDTDANVLEAERLTDLTFNVISCVTTPTVDTTLVFSLTTCFGTYGKEGKYKGLTLADLGTINATIGGVVTDITANATLTEVEGVYTLVIVPELTAGDTLQLDFVKLLECYFSVVGNPVSKVII